MAVFERGGSQRCCGRNIHDGVGNGAAVGSWHGCPVSKCWLAAIGCIDDCRTGCGAGDDHIQWRVVKPAVDAEGSIFYESVEASGVRSPRRGRREVESLDTQLVSTYQLWQDQKTIIRSAPVQSVNCQNVVAKGETVRAAADIDVFKYDRAFCGLVCRGC